MTINSKRPNHSDTHQNGKAKNERLRQVSEKKKEPSKPSLHSYLDKQSEKKNRSIKNVLDVGECRSCGRKFNKLMRLCPYCGTFNPMEATYKEPFCPACAVKLENKIYRDTDLLVCPLCAGMWIDTFEFQVLTSEREVFSDSNIPFSFDKKPFDPTPQSYVKCVRCRRLMVQSNFKNVSGILLSQCRDHGVWLNAGALTQIRTFIANGGLHKAHETEIRKNASEIAYIAQKTQNLEFMQKMLHKWSPKFLFFNK
ncbi:MAG: hypothetical protein GF401_11480 [Chitinivibrionales bacterium]|nr:hypothetical protein [Chitinivibrionales bacterium]